MTSRYIWKDNFCCEQEELLIIKTTREGAEKIHSHLEQDHPYSCPEWIELEPEKISESYARWLLSQVKVT
jgi:periplasmic divalent cation tolerance protein